MKTQTESIIDQLMQLVTITHYNDLINPDIVSDLIKKGLVSKYNGRYFLTVDGIDLLINIDKL